MSHHPLFRPLFRGAAAFNFAVGAPMLLAPALVYRLAGAPAPAMLLEGRMIGLFVMLFGVLYWLIGERTPLDVPLLQLGIAGKGAAFALTLRHWLAGQSPSLFAALGTVDLIFGLLFFYTWQREVH